MHVIRAIIQVLLLAAVAFVGANRLQNDLASAHAFAAAWSVFVNFLPVVVVGALLFRPRVSRNLRAEARRQREMVLLMAAIRTRQVELERQLDEWSRSDLEGQHLADSMKAVKVDDPFTFFLSTCSAAARLAEKARQPTEANPLLYPSSSDEARRAPLQRVLLSAA